MDQTDLTRKTLTLQHERLAIAIDGLEAIVAGPPPTTFDELASLRWAFTRDMLLHFTNVQKRVLDPLMSDRREAAARKAARSSDDLRSVCEQFARHAMRWKGLPPGENWPAYATAIALLMRRVRVRLAAQQTEIYPLLPAQPGGATVLPLKPPLDYAGEAWKVRTLIYRDEAARQAAA